MANTNALLTLFGTRADAVDRCLRVDLPRAHVCVLGRRVRTVEELESACRYPLTLCHKLPCTQIFLVPVVELLTRLLCSGGTNRFVGENPIGRSGYPSRHLQVRVGATSVTVTKHLRVFDPTDESGRHDLKLRVMLGFCFRDRIMMTLITTVVCL